MHVFVSEDHMLGWHPCQICNPLEIKLLLSLLLLHCVDWNSSNYREIFLETMIFQKKKKKKKKVFFWTKTHLCLFVLDEPPRDKTSIMTVRPAKTQINLGIRPVLSESSLCAQWVAKDPRFLHADSENSDQTGRMPRLILVFAGRTTTLVASSWGGSDIIIGRKG